MFFSVSVFINRLVPNQDGSPCGGSSRVTGLQLQLGRQTVQCSAYVKGKNIGSRSNYRNDSDFSVQSLHSRASSFVSPPAA